MLMIKSNYYGYRKTDFARKNGEKVRDFFAKKTISIKRISFHLEYGTIINFSVISK